MATKKPLDIPYFSRLCAATITVGSQFNIILSFKGRRPNEFILGIRIAAT